MIPAEMMKMKRVYPPPPEKWPELIVEHESTLVRVHMLWRCGRSSYREMVPNMASMPTGTAFEGEHELDEVNFEWFADPDLSCSERHDRAVNTVAELWEVAKLWSGALGIPCDFKFMGHDSDEEVIFNLASVANSGLSLLPMT